MTAAVPVTTALAGWVEADGPGCDDCGWHTGRLLVSEALPHRYDVLLAWAADAEAAHRAHLLERHVARAGAAVIDRRLLLSLIVFVFALGVAAGAVLLTVAAGGGGLGLLLVLLIAGEIGFFVGLIVGQA